MIWQNPLAWFGSLFLAVPILLHMLGRHRPRVQEFPSLRFLTTTRLLPARRTRISDWLVLTARTLTLLLAVLALAQPLLLTHDRERAASRTLARAIILDTSASMLRGSANGERGIVLARREARALAQEAQTSVVIETASPALAVRGAIAWLNTQPSRAELAVVSDFQIGTLDKADLADIPTSVGIRLRPTPVAVGDSVFTSTAPFGADALITRTTITSDQTSVDWRRTATIDSGPRARVKILVGTKDSVALDVVRRATVTLGGATMPALRDVIALVYPAHAARRALLLGAHPLHAPWMTHVIAQLLADSLLLATVTDVAVATDSITTAHAAVTVVMRNAVGRAVLLAAGDSIDGHSRLLLFSQFELASLTSPALLHAIEHAVSNVTPLREYEPARVAADSLRMWERPPANITRPRVTNAWVAPPTESDGRWVWLAVLMMLGVESWLRRSRPNASRDVIA